jgi:hypothetical protein
MSIEIFGKPADPSQSFLFIKHEPCVFDWWCYSIKSKENGMWIDNKGKIWEIVEKAFSNMTVTSPDSIQDKLELISALHEMRDIAPFS